MSYLSAYGDKDTTMTTEQRQEWQAEYNRVVFATAPFVATMSMQNAIVASDAFVRMAVRAANWHIMDTYGIPLTPQQKIGNETL